MQNLVRFAAGLELTFVIRIVFKQIPVDAVEAVFGYLSSGGVIEKDSRTIQSWELLTDEINICTEPGRSV